MGLLTLHSLSTRFNNPHRVSANNDEERGAAPPMSESTPKLSGGKSVPNRWAYLMYLVLTVAVM